MKKNILYIIAVVLTLSGCNKFLDIEPKGKVIPTTIEDYDLLLTPIAQLKIEEALFFTADDFVAEKAAFGDITNPDNTQLHLYTYSNRRFANPEIVTDAWNQPYENLYVYNKVIDEIDNATDALGYTQKDKIRIKAEAKWGRAVQYFFLVNMFGKHYNKASATSDGGVPIVLKATTLQKPPLRAKVSEVYDLIIKDLTEALPDLPKKRVEINRPSKGAGYAMLARVYLYRREYDLALKNANLALAENNTLVDYTSADFSAESFDEYDNEFYTKIVFDYSLGFTYGYLSSEMMNLYDTVNDMRANGILECAWVMDPSTHEYYQDCTKRGNAFKVNPSLIPSIPEMYLTAAECYARDNKKAEALQKLNELRKKRIVNVGELTDGDFATSYDLLKFVLEERRRELVMSGTRLFDLKRLNLDPRFAKTVEHPFGTEVYKAEANSGKLVLPIPMQVKKFNPNL